MKKLVLFFAPALMLHAGLTHAAEGTDQIEHLFDSMLGGQSGACADTVKISLTDAIRAGIDTEVARKEAALQQPKPVDGLGCLDNLMNLDLDIAIQVPDVQGLFDSALSNAEQQICSFAQEAWDKATEPLTSALQLPSFDGISVDSFTGGSSDVLDFGSVNMGLSQGGDYGGDAGVRGAGANSLLRDTYQKLYGTGGQ
ncbi:hypothetical protein [Martelella mediterranea]|uniref:Uncharacterized protein n=1 Tax=Martelella mediterranea TaxID=293089 RepID=A0A4R3NSH8_9HYPH|nr:hypothetical protein [Martelella mediterranea]TCT36036.1 hypothetical protein EDC90_102420 [Martelella mediterranea]